MEEKDENIILLSDVWNIIKKNAAFGKAVGYRRKVCGRTHPDNLHQPDSQQD